MNTSILLYQPTANEIAHVAQSAAHRHPELAGRIAKAAELLASGSLQLDAVAWERGQLARWRVASQSGKGAYVVCGLSCPCQDSRHNGVSHCKHAIAAALYLKILANRFNVDVRNREIDLGVEDSANLHAYARKMGYVQVKRVAGAYVFTSAASAVHYAIWLAAHPVAVEWPIAQPAMMAAAL